MKEVLFVTNMTRHFHTARKCIAKLGKIGATTIALEEIGNDTPWTPAWEARLRNASIVLLTYMGSGLDTAFLRQFAKFGKQADARFMMLIDSVVTPEMNNRVTDEDILVFKKYIAYSGHRNYLEMFRWAASHFASEDIKYGAPEPLPWEGIWCAENNQIYVDFARYKEEYCVPGQPYVGVLFYREEWIAGDLFYQREIAETIRQYGMNPVIFFAQHGGNPEVGAPNLAGSLRYLFGTDDKHLNLDLLINMSKFSMLGLRSVTQKDLLDFDIPILQGYGMGDSEDAWRESIQGMGAMDVNLAVSLPETDGVIHGGVVAGRVPDEAGETRYLPVVERIDAIVRKAKKWIALRHKENAAKKIAIVFHNYPADNSNIGSAVGLDSIESVRRILARMKAEGYCVDNIPEDTAEFIKDITGHATNDRRYVNEEFFANADGKLTKAEYQEWFDTRSEHVRAKMENDWGEAPGDVFNYDNSLLIPGYINGNVFITVQPPRGFGEDASKLYHSPDATPTHHYEAFYYWLREKFHADAVLHIGTHGTLEWLPGKGTGLSADCYPEMAIDDLPNIYPYWTTIVGEGIQAKRRSAACMIGHLTPPQDRSGLYEDMEDLENLLDEYFHFRMEKPDAIGALEEVLLEKAEKAHLLDEIPGSREMDMPELTAAMHNYLTDIKNMQMRAALHILGQAPKGERKVKYLSVLTRVDNDETQSLPETIATAKGFDWDELNTNTDKMAPDGRLYSEHLTQIWDESEALLTFLDEKDYQYSDDWQTEAFVQSYSTEGKKELVKTLLWIANHLAPLVDRTTEEMDHLFDAMSGHYIEPGPGGAATSGRIDVLPTGRNFYGIDTRKMPTEAAWNIGVQMADDVIEQFIADEGRYPEMVGIVLWAGANTRSHGQCVAQFMALIGVRPVWQKGSGKVVGLEVIPLEELKRPRIDVTGRISGLFRDMMPTPAKWLDEAVRVVSELDEPDEMNYLKKHINDDVEWLMAEEGNDYETAFEQARWRIFGDAPGAYGAGVADLLEEKNWETIDDIGDVYVRWGGHVYSKTQKGAYQPELFRRRLQQMEITIQNQDNREVSMLSSDDYNAYHGGMIAAVRSNSGKMPHSYSGDSSDRSRIKVRTLKAEMHRLFRGEAGNPKFIEGMKEHGYKGAADLAGYVAHAYQWDVTSDVLEQWMYDTFADKYALDEEMKKWMSEVNPWALQRIAAVLLEADQRGYWEASDERKQELQNIYLSMEGDLEESADINKQL